MARAVNEAGAAGQARRRAGDVVRLAARAHERDRYLASLLAPAGVRDDLIALAAFIGEVVRIPAYVSEPLIGEIRLQWWHDAIEAIGGDGASGPGSSIVSRTGNPIADALGEAARRHRLTAAMLLPIVEAERAHLLDQPFADMTALAANLAASQTTAFEVAWRILAQPAVDAGPPALLAEAGQAYGMARVLLEWPALVAQRRCRIPLDMMRRHGAGSADLHRPHEVAAVPAVAGEFAGLALTVLGRVRAGWRDAPAAVRAAVLPVALVQPYLRVCQRSRYQAAFEARHAACDVAPLTRVWRILWSAQGGCP